MEGFYSFNLTLGIWIQLTDDIMSGNPPCGRSGFGFSSMKSLLYVFGGNGSSGLLPHSPLLNRTLIEQNISSRLINQDVLVIRG